MHRSWISRITAALCAIFILAPSGVSAVSVHPAVPTEKIPILMYHYIEEHDAKLHPKGANLFISPAFFEKQLQWLEEHGYQTVDPATALGILHHTVTDAPKKPIVLTFDDGWEDAYTTVLPLLLKYHMRGVFYIIS